MLADATAAVVSSAWEGGWWTGDEQWKQADADQRNRSLNFVKEIWAHGHTDRPCQTKDNVLAAPPVSVLMIRNSTVFHSAFLCLYARLCTPAVGVCVRLLA